MNRGSSPLTPGVLRNHRRHSAKIEWPGGRLIIEIVPRPSMLADIQGIAMWWFSKGKRQRKEIWDENIQWPIGDIEAAVPVANLILLGSRSRIGR
jgi:hypothetical protein